MLYTSTLSGDERGLKSAYSGNNKESHAFCSTHLASTSTSAPKPTNSLAISQIRRASSFKTEIGTNSDTLSYRKHLRVSQPVLASRSHNAAY